MSSDLGLLRERELETNIYSSVASESSSEDVSQSLESLLESTEGLNPVSESTTSVIFWGRRWRYGIEHLPESIQKSNPVSESITSPIFSDADRFDFSPMVVIIRSELPQPPETHWVQNLRHPSYQLRQSIPVLVERAGDTVSASYEDVELYGTGESVKAAILDLCANIVAHYEELKANGVKSQEYTFLKQIIEEIQPPAWEDFKQLYQEKLKELPYVQKGYINIDGQNADVVIILSEESVEKIEQLATIDLDLYQRFDPLCFRVEYENSTDYLELDDFECFYELP